MCSLPCWSQMLDVWSETCSYSALCVKPLRNLEIKNLRKMLTLAPIFSSQNYFRWKYLEVFSFAVSLSIYIWVRVEKSLLQQQKLPKNQLQFKQAAERMCIKLRGPVEHFPWKLNPNIVLSMKGRQIFGKYLYFSNVKFTMKGCRHKFVVF